VSHGGVHLVPRLRVSITETSTDTNQQMKKIRITQFVMLAAVRVALTSAANAADLSDKDKQFLASYEKVHAALVADDLNGAKAAAGDLGTEGADLSKSSSLKEARGAFEKLSAEARQLAIGQTGYRVYHCPMLKKDWVQISTTVANPYGGKDMIGCGEIQK
jgi:hypothetical protein